MSELHDLLERKAERDGSPFSPPAVAFDEPSDEAVAHAFRSVLAKTRRRRARRRIAGGVAASLALVLAASGLRTPGPGPTPPPTHTVAAPAPAAPREEPRDLRSSLGIRGSTRRATPTIVFHYAQGRIRPPHADPSAGFPRASGTTLTSDQLVLVGISPDGRHALLSASTRGNPTGSSRPRLYVANYKGHRFSHPRPVSIPAASHERPLGWIGANVFVVAAGPGKARIVRLSGDVLTVLATGIPDPCGLPGAPTGCRPAGPWLVGTDATGSLLYWKVGAIRPGVAGSRRKPGRVAFFSTWLDGTHALALPATRAPEPADRRGPS